MKRRTLFIVLIGIIGFLGLSFLLNLFLTVPPGCMFTNRFLMGGCLGKNLNRNFHIYPELPSCLKIRSHVCLSAQLEIENLCSSSEKITIQGIPITDKYTYFLFGLDNQGKVVKINSENLPSYPDSDENISLNMKMNDENYDITYIRTKPLCQ